MNVVQPASWLRICAGKSEVAPDEQLLDFVADRIGNPMIDERMARSHENLKMIRFEGELLPNWARLLDLASGLCAVPEETRRWFSALTNSNGVEDGRTVVEHCELLRGELQRRREEVLSELRRDKQDVRPMQVYGAWMYALETMIQEAKTGKTCAWFVEGAEDSGGGFGDGGEITLRRV